MTDACPALKRWAIVTGGGGAVPVSSLWTSDFYRRTLESMKPDSVWRRKDWARTKRHIGW